jgi:hypothetical protein
VARIRLLAPLLVVLALAAPALADVTLTVESPTRAPHLTWVDTGAPGQQYVVLRSGNACQLHGASVFSVGTALLFDDASATDGVWCYSVAPDGGTASAEALVRVDTTPPMVAISAPLAGAFVAGNVTLQATAGDPGGSGIASVEFLAGPTTVPAAPANGLYTAVWPSATGPDGPVLLSVHATDTVGNDATSSVPVTVDNTPPTGSFTAPVASSINAGDVVVTAALADGGSGIASATFEVSTDGFVSTRQLGTITEPVLTDVRYHWATTAQDDAAGYAFRVRVVDHAGNETTVLGPTDVRIDNTPPAAPGVLLGAPTFVHTAPAIAWTTSASRDVISYRVFRDGTLVADTVLGTTYTDATSVSDGSHSYTIEAFDGLHASDPSPAIPVFLDTVAPGAPLALTRTIPVHTRDVVLAWSAASDLPHDPGGPFSDIGSYEVTRDGTVVADLAPTSTTWSDLQTADAVSYRYDVTAVDRAGNRSPIATLTVVTPDITPPHAAGAFASRVRGGAIRLTWRPPTDADLVRVVVVRNGLHAPTSPTDGTVVYAGRGASATAKQVGGSRYTYVVFSVDRAQNATATSALRIAIPASHLLPLPGSELKGKVSLTWTKVKGATYYNVQLWSKGKKLLDRWPTRAGLRVPAKLLRPGVRYTWFVWPGIGPLSAHTYGKLLGNGSFTYLG